MAVLAYYTIRSKQAFIFHSNVMVEISGASRMIADAFRQLFDAAAQSGLKTQTYQKDEPFSLEKVKAAFADGSIQMVDVFCGGGNDTVLYDSIENYKLANAAFTYRLEHAFPGMVPLCTAVETSLDGQGDYKQDWKRLMKQVDREKNRMLADTCIPMLPFSQMDRNVFQPVTGILKERDNREVTRESAAKFQYGKQNNVLSLEDLVPDKGVESLLAMVHADGNNMGEKIRGLLGDLTDYDTCVSRMRSFSYETDQTFARKACQAVDAIYNSLAGTKKILPVRWLIRDGDDVTFVCNARDALLYASTYLQSVEDSTSGQYSSCAGICIFHSHYPFYMAYEMAEQACESAKAALRKTGNRQGSWLDFHYIHSGLSEDLELTRKKQGTDDLIARPFSLRPSAIAGTFSIEQLSQLAAAFQALRTQRQSGEQTVTRTNIKTLGSAWEASRQSGPDELKRVCARAPGLKSRLETICGRDDASQLRLIYDLSEIYDLWYAGQERGK